MKIKKFIATVLFVFTLIAGGFSQSQPVFAALNKKQVVSIIKKDNKNTNSSKLNANVVTKIKKDKVYADFSFTSNLEKKLIHQVGTLQYKNKNVNVEVWYDIPANRAYINNNGKWEYVTIDFNDVKNGKYNNALTAPLLKELEKKGKLKHQGDTYTLSSNINLKKYMKLYMRLISKEKISKKDANYLKKNVKLSSVPVVYTVENQKFVSSRVKYNGSLNKQVKLKVKMSLGNFGEYETLTLPEETKNAVKMKED